MGAIGMSDEKLKLIDDNAPRLPEKVRSLGDAIALVWQLIERERLTPRVICIASDPDHDLGFEDVKRTTTVDGLGFKEVEKLVYTAKGAEKRLRLAMGMVVLQGAGQLSPFGGINDIVNHVYQIWEFRLAQAMRHCSEIACRFLAELHSGDGNSEPVLFELFKAAAAFHTVDTGSKPKWAKGLKPCNISTSEES